MTSPDPRPLTTLSEQWEIQPGDTHTVEARYRRDAWWFSNQRGDSLFVEPKDVAAFLDAAGATLDAERAPREGDGLREAAQAWLDYVEKTSTNLLMDDNERALMRRLRAALAPAAPHPDESHEFRTTCLRCGEPGHLFVSVLAPGETMTLNPAPAALAPATPADRVDDPLLSEDEGESAIDARARLRAEGRL